ncbi:class I SAM-dependent methyltransferase [Rhodonellum sp.]|uniref:class I SAM-dependent methyltransferase n=1 Tax=Rhodonellum sp. TaxID=2231180 RepID=UPI002715A800|nr:class I SAM-dependent methyltransferase [Rhodonellum sp.]MDO9553712.1 class I SAM-dependent methyltransferase [Rhodonellum sp.]
MDFKSLHTEALKKFVQDHLQEDPALLLFKHQGKTDFDLKTAVQQISARQKAKKKLPTWAANPEVIFPAGISVEQCSSEETAKFKAEFVSGRGFLDMTGGFGVDTFFIGQHFDTVTYFERNESLAAIVQQNFELLQPNKFAVHSGDAITFLRSIPHDFDLIYLDPARRGDHNQKLYKFSDCEPDVTDLWDLLTNKANQILVKASPILEIKSALKELPKIQKIWVLSVKNEVKEILLYWSNAEAENEPEIICTDLTPEGKQTFAFTYEEEETANAIFGATGKYLIEPNASLLKAGAFKSFSERYQLKKLHPNSHLYTTDVLEERIPGRVFEVIGEVKADKKELKKKFPKGIVNVITRNYSLKAEAFKNKFNLKDGGHEFLIGTKEGEKYRVYHCKPFSQKNQNL